MKRVIAIVFSNGEKSHPWLRKAVVKKFREKETHQAAKVLGCRVLFLNMGDQQIYEDYKEKNLEPELLKILNRIKPAKIFTHSNEDHHSDHRAVYAITSELCDKIEFKPEVYIFPIWNPVSFKSHYPSFYVDISKTFYRKLKAVHLFRSQRFNAIYPLMTLIFQRAILSGFKIKKKFGESFYRIR